MKRGIVKKISMTALVSVVCVNTYAVGPGMYLGVMAGPASNTASTQQAKAQSSSTMVNVSPRTNQFGSRLFMGYQFNNYAAVEGGLTYVSSINYNTYGVETCGGTVARVRDFDLVGKGSIPFANYFDVYGKAGAAVTYTTTSGGLNSTPTSCGQTTYKTAFRPTVSVGASYYLNQSWVADLSWNSIMVGSTVGNISIFALGISYHFVDVYCGQFLCN